MSDKYQCLKCKLGHYCKFGNFREAFIFAKLRAKFRENKILAKWRDHSVIYRYGRSCPSREFKRRKYSVGSSSHMSHRK